MWKFNSPKWPESKMNDLSNSLQILKDFWFNYNKRSERDKRMKQKVWKEYKNQLHKDLGLSLKELDNRNEWAVAEACNLIDDSNLESFYNALDRSSWESHDFLKMLEKFFIEKGYINKVNRELTNVFWQCKTLSDALYTLKDFVFHHDDRSERDSRMKKRTWSEYKAALSSKLWISIKELNKWDESTVVSACRSIWEPNFKWFRLALNSSVWKPHEFLEMLLKVFEKNKFIKRKAQ